MNPLHRALNYLEDFKQKYQLKVKWLSLVLITSSFWLIHKYKNGFAGTNRIPEPFNIFNHIGNVDSAVPALLLSILVGYTLTRLWNPKSGLAIFWIAILIGTSVGLTANILIELPYGMDLLDQQNVTDPLDVIYGTFFCFIITALSIKITAINTKIKNRLR